MNKIRVIFIILLGILILGCSSKVPLSSVKVNSPLGLYKSNTSQKYWVAIMQNDQYLLCSTVNCVAGKYQKVPADYGVILLGFYETEIGLSIEKLSHGKNNTEAFYKAMQNLRLGNVRPNDFAFNIGDCRGTPCVGLGHTREGVKFYRVEDFDEYWHSDKADRNDRNRKEELND